MNRIHVVTDSSVLQANPNLLAQYEVTIVPLYIRFGDERFVLDAQLDPEQFIDKMRYEGVTPELEAPTPEELHQVYAQLNQETTRIISIHMSNKVCPIVENAKLASKMLLGRCDIIVVDTLNLSCGATFLVKQAAIMARTITDLQQMVREVRRMISRIYAVFYVESMQVLAHRRLLGEAQTILGTMLGIMPLVTIEDGQLTIMEKALNGPQAVDKLIEFASEFIDVEELVIFHHHSALNDTLRYLQDRLAAELGTANFPTRVYDSSIATLLGPDASGIAIFEREYEDELY
jgi:uncharacterized protein